MSSFDGLASARPIAELRGAAPLVVGSGWSGVISAGGGLPSGVTGTSCTCGVLWGAVCCAEVAVPVNAASTATISIADRSLFLMRCSLGYQSQLNPRQPVPLSLTAWRLHGQSPNCAERLH